MLRPSEFRAEHAASPECGSEIASGILLLTGECAAEPGKPPVITVYCRSRHKQRLIHLNPAPPLYRSHRIGGDRLVHVAEPRHAWRRSTRTTLGNTVRLQRTRGLENDL